MPSAIRRFAGGRVDRGFDPFPRTGDTRRKGERAPIRVRARIPPGEAPWSPAAVDQRKAGIRFASINADCKRRLMVSSLRSSLPLRGLSGDRPGAGANHSASYGRTRRLMRSNFVSFTKPFLLLGSTANSPGKSIDVRLDVA